MWTNVTMGVNVSKYDQMRDYNIQSEQVRSNVR